MKYELILTQPLSSSRDTDFTSGSLLHAARVRTAIRTNQAIRRNREREGCSALLAGNGLAVHVNGEAACFTDHLLRTGERFDIGAATAAVTSFAFMRPHFIIFGMQAVEL